MTYAPSLILDKEFLIKSRLVIKHLAILILLKGWNGTKTFPLPLIPFTTEEITDCTNEAANSANKAPRNPPV